MVAAESRNGVRSPRELIGVAVFCLVTVKARQPLQDAHVEVRAVKGKPGYYEAVAYLRPHFQLEALSASMRLVAEVPNEGMRPFFLLAYTAVGRYHRGVASLTPATIRGRVDRQVSVHS